jgi:hypothetical protein
MEGKGSLQGGFIMCTTRTVSAVLIAAFAVALVGCSDDNVLDPNAMTADQQAISDLIAAAPEFQHDVVSHAIPDTTAGLAASVTGNHYWWREYTSVDRQMTITTYPADTVTEDPPYAEVTITSTYGGQFHIVHRSAEGVYTHTTKAMTDIFTQSARFERRAPVGTQYRGWQPVELSNIVGGSNPTTLSIDLVAISPAESEYRHYTPDNIHVLFPGSEKMVLNGDEEVSMLVQTGTGTNDVFFHDWYLGNSTRTQFSNNEVGYYSHSLTTPSSLTSAQVRRHHVIDVIAPDVIEGDAAYDAIIWAIPYVVDISGTPN